MTEIYGYVPLQRVWLFQASLVWSRVKIVTMLVWFEIGKNINLFGLNIE